jgi:hypothetical protein
MQPAVPVNLYVDHLTNSTLVSADDLYAQLQSQPKLFADAAHAIGLTPSEYVEFRNDLLDGDADYVTLPHHIDAMSGAHRGHAYAVRNALVPDGVKGWLVMLKDGTKVYVPRICGNLSVVREPIVASHFSIGSKAKLAVAPPPAPIPVTPVILTPPEPDDVAIVPQTVVAGPPARTAQVPAGVYGLPLLGFLFDHTGTGSTPGVIPLCSAGSNALGVCSTK